MLRKLLAAVIGALVCGGAVAAGSSLENPQPGSIESGIGVISGWYCPAAAITIQIDDAAPIPAPYGSLRGDAAASCDGVVATGFSYLINYNTLVAGPHTIKAFADGVLFGTTTFNVVNLGSEFLTDRTGEYYLHNFPDYGKRTRVTWQQSKQNFVVSGSDTQVAPVEGTYFGAVRTVSSGCTTPSNNNTFTDFDEFTVAGNGALLTLTTTSRTIANSACTFSGNANYTPNGGEIVVLAGNFACTNGLQGTWASERMVFDTVGMLVRMTTRYTVGETCTTVNQIGAAR